MLHLLLLVVLLASQASATCPQSPISSSGSLSAPAHCELEFQIPNGYVVKFGAQGTLGANDTVVLNDMLSESHSLLDGTVVFAPADSAQLLIDIQSPSTFTINWQFINLQKLRPVRYQTGNVATVTFKPFQPITFYQTGYGPIRLLHDTPNDYQNVLVFDGADLRAPCIGRLGSGSVVSRGSSLTLIMFDNSVKYVEGHFLAVEAEIGDVTFHDLTRDSYQDISKFDISSSSAIFFSGSNHSSIESMTSDNDLSFEVRAGAPTTKASNVVLSYEGTPLNNNFPQQINSRLFTIFMKKGNAVSTISKTPLSSTWNSVQPRRKGAIISQSVWESSSSANYDETFHSKSPVLFKFSLNGVHMLTDNELLTIEIGDGNGNPEIFAFNQTTFDEFSRTVQGNYMRVWYTGAANQRSTFWVNFEVLNQKQV